MIKINRFVIGVGPYPAIKTSPDRFSWFASVLSLSFILIGFFRAVLFGEIIPPDRRIQWNPGILKDIDGTALAQGAVPERTTIYKTLNPGTTTGQIQSAIDNCPSGQVVFLSAGTYTLTTGIIIQTSNIVIRGAGPDKTKLICTMSSDRAFRFNNWSRGGDWSSVNPTGGYIKGSDTITVPDASAFKVGDVVDLDQIDDTATIVLEHGNWARNGNRSIHQVNVVIGKKGTTLTMASPWYWTFQARYSPQLSTIWDGCGRVRYTGIEDLYIKSPSEGINFDMCSYCWVKNIECDTIGGTHIWVNGYRNVVRDSYIHHAWSYNNGGDSYGIHVMGSDCLIENNIIYYMEMPLGLQMGGGGNVYAYNYIKDALLSFDHGWNISGVRTHCAYPHMELLEGNMSNSINVERVNGGAGYITIFRNYCHGLYENIINPDTPSQTFTPSGPVACEVQHNCNFVNIIGNVYWKPGVTGAYQAAGPWGECDGVYRIGANCPACNNPCGPYDSLPLKSLIRHGNFDYVTNSQIWDATISDRNIPNSLYLTAKPVFFGNCPWPWVTPEGTSKLFYLPAKNRFEGINPCPVQSVTIKEGRAVKEGFIVRSHPLSRESIFEYTLTANSYVKLMVLDLMGKKVSALVDGRQLPKTYSIVWTRKNTWPGVYVCRLTIDNSTSIRKFIVK
jgi:hypothetical protein